MFLAATILFFFTINSNTSSRNKRAFFSISNEIPFRTLDNKRTKRRNPKDAEGPREVAGNPIQIQSGSETVENFVLPDGGQPVTLKFHKTTFKPKNIPNDDEEVVIEDNVENLAQETPVVIQVDEPILAAPMRDKGVLTSLPPLKTSTSFVRLPGYHIPPQSPPPPPPLSSLPPLVRRPRPKRRPRKNPGRRKPGAAAVAGASAKPAGRRRRKKNLKERLSDLRKSLF